MICNICGHPLKTCICQDIDFRLKAITDTKYLIFGWCGGCDKHIDRCKCVTSLLGTRTNGKFSGAAMN